MDFCLQALIRGAFCVCERALADGLCPERDSPRNGEIKSPGLARGHLRSALYFSGDPLVLMMNCLKASPLVLGLMIALVAILPGVGFSQEKVSIHDFYVLDWLKALKLVWKARAPEGAEGTFEVYRSDEVNGPYSLVQETKLGDKEFIDVITKTYLFFDRRLEANHSYYYKLGLRGTNQTLGPLRGLARGGPPGT